MTEVPTTGWTPDFDEAQALDGAPVFRASKSKRPLAWRRLAGAVRHVFTHFPLELFVYAAEFPAGTPAPAGTRWVALTDIGGEALPSVMRKVLVHALGRKPVAKQGSTL
jgi:A/G-specific adenine glycosylase